MEGVFSHLTDWDTEAWSRGWGKAGICPRCPGTWASFPYRQATLVLSPFTSHLSPGSQSTSPTHVGLGWASFPSGMTPYFPGVRAFGARTPVPSLFLGSSYTCRFTCLCEAQADRRWGRPESSTTSEQPGLPAGRQAWSKVRTAFQRLAKGHPLSGRLRQQGSG